MVDLTQPNSNLRKNKRKKIKENKKEYINKIYKKKKVRERKKENKSKKR